MGNKIEKYSLIAIVSLIVLLVSVNSIIERRNYVREYEAERERIERRNDSIARVNDSIAKLREIMLKQQAEEMAKREMSSTIFAGLRFGDSPETVKTTLRNRRKRIIQVPIEDKVDTVYVADYDAKYYKGRLASLTLYTDDTELEYALTDLFSVKYGEPVFGGWHFANCHIAIYSSFRKEYTKDYGYRRSNTNRPILYYNTYRGEKSEFLTQKSSFLKIVYEDKKLLQLIEREKIVADSLENVRRLKAIEKEKELARKLATEVPTNI